MGITKALLNWFSLNKRDLPWRTNTEAYSVWLSEIILQQTQVIQGLPYYNKFINSYPKVCLLAQAPLDDVLKLWQGLGYYSRAKNLHQTAQIICKKHQGKFPNSYKELLKLKGVGPYTAAAIASIAFNEPVACVDGNVLRVISRLFDIKTPVDTKEGYNEVLINMEQLIDPKQAGNFNQAVMELGALICTPKKPKCESCPLINFCFSFTLNDQEEKPVKTKKIKVQKSFIDYLIIYDNKKVVLNKRNEDSIWKNLYEFPQITQAKESENTKRLYQLKEEYSSENTDIQFHSKIKHKLTHRELLIKFHTAKVKKLSHPNAHTFLDAKKCAVPKPVSIALEELFSEKMK